MGADFDPSPPEAQKLKNRLRFELLAFFRSPPPRPRWQGLTRAARFATVRRESGEGIPLSTGSQRWVDP
jgi:hypothetical protein